MADSFPGTAQAAQVGFAAMDAERASELERQLRRVVVRRAAGNGDVAHVFSLERRFRLIYVRCHFVGGSGVNALTLSQESNVASVHNTLLFSFIQAGTGWDIHLRITAEESLEPSPWVFEAGDAVKLAWINPDGPTMTWGIEVGLALAT